MNKPSFIEHPWERRGVIAPGLPILPHGVERHPVPGGGSRAVPVFKGDEISVLDKDGLQPGELVFFAPDRRSDAAMLGARGSGRPARIIETLANGTPSGARVLKALGAAGFDIEAGDAIAIFTEGSQPGSTQSFIAECDGLLICAAPGGPMAPEAQNAPTELILYIRRACDDPSSQIVCADDVPCMASTAEPPACFGEVDVRQSRVTVTLPAGTYYVFVDAFEYTSSGIDFTCGTVELSVTSAE